MFKITIVQLNLNKEGFNRHTEKKKKTFKNVYFCKFFKILFSIIASN